MAAWQATAGATLLMPTGPGGDHLHIVLNDPKQFAGYGSHPCVVLVNVSTLRAGISHDPTCILSAGCHPFVKDESYVVYRSARIEQASHVLLLVRQGLFKPHLAVTPQILTLIRVGIRSSPFATREFKNLLI
jgi:hypothetical protein